MRFTNQISCVKLLILALNNQLKSGRPIDIDYDIETGHFPVTAYDVTHDCPIYGSDMSYDSNSSYLCGEYDYGSTNTCSVAKHLLDGSFSQYFIRYPFVLNNIGLTSLNYQGSSDPARWIDDTKYPFTVVAPEQIGDTLQVLDDDAQLSHRELRNELRNKFRNNK